MAGMSKAGNQYSVGRKQAKSLLTQKPSASVPLGGMNWGNIVTRGGLKMLGVLGGIMSPRKTASDKQMKKHKLDETMGLVIDETGYWPAGFDKN